LIALRFNEASSSLIPPDKKVTPTIAGVRDLDKAIAVLIPISYGVTFSLSGFYFPGVTIAGLRRHPSQKIPFY